MYRLRAHWFDWLFRHVIARVVRRVRPITIIPPWVQRLGLRLVRRPVPKTVRPLALIWRHADVAEVLGDHERFSVNGYDEKMTECSHPFLLGYDFKNPEYHRQIALLRSVLRPEDRDRIREIAARHAKNGIAAALPKGRIDVVQQIVAPVMSGFLLDYFGVGELGTAEPGRLSPTLHRFLDTATYIFNLDVLTGKTKGRALQAGEEIKAHLESIIGAKRSAPPPAKAGDTVIDRLLARTDVPDELVRTLMGGTVAGSIAVTFSQCLWVIDRLMNLPPVRLAEVQHVARSGDEALLDRYVREASRFKPFPPGLLRRCEAHQTVAAGTRRERTLPAGTVVAAITWSAAFDPEVVGNPLEFHVGRAEGEYLLFGTGQHHCVAAQPERPIAQTLMAQMVKAVFELRGLRRAPGAAGFIKPDDSSGHWAEQFVLEFDAAGAQSVTPARAA